MPAVPTTYRNGCGTFLGLKLHQAADEHPCSECLIAEERRLLEATLLRELVPVRPTPLEPLPPITPEQAARNLATLNAEMRRPPRVPNCGSYAAWQRHQRNGEEIDPACATAARRYRKTRNLALQQMTGRAA
ncbi:hypothetical protein ACIHFD_49510 [Nonomuraea sp. NPDC051941]|uniref:hypothetical protein n=1 Tax=Nonomuraea sp. NPDC051941 TaxID=3364373 RepID=UPI0037C800F3